MAEIISYPVNTNILDTGLLLGTHIPPVGEGKPTSTKNFSVSALSSFINLKNTLQTVVNNGNTIVLQPTTAKGIDITLDNLEPIYQNGMSVTVPNQTGAPYPTYNPCPDAYIAKLNGQSPGNLVGFVGGFVVETTGVDNIAFSANFDSTSGNSRGIKLISNGGHTGDYILTEKINGSVHTYPFVVNNAGDVACTQYKLNALNTAPTDSEDTGTTGEIRYTSDYIYVCVATNSWKRSQLTSW